MSYKNLKESQVKVRIVYMLRPDLQPLARFKTGWLVLKLAGQFRSWLLLLYNKYAVWNFTQAIIVKNLKQQYTRYPL